MERKTVFAKKRLSGWWSPTTALGDGVLAATLVVTMGGLCSAEDLTPAEIFRRVSPSVVVVLALSPDREAFAQGSGVVVAGGIVTNRHVVQGAGTIQIRQGDRTWSATIAHWDDEHDLVQLEAKGCAAPPVVIRGSTALHIGQRVYAVGAPKGWELTLSEGLVSGLRPVDGVDIIQTTAPISPGSSGGGLFDSHGQLVGITAMGEEEAQNLNFALPTQWVLALPRYEGKTLPLSSAEGFIQRGRQLLGKGELPRAASAFVAGLKAAPVGVVTIQILVACADETVLKVLQNAAGPELFIVPVSFKGRDCYRVCWGLYESETPAIGALQGIPEYFIRGGATPKVIPVNAIVP